MLEAVDLTARLEGLVLDPVYTGKTMAGLIDLIRQGRFENGQNVVFIHTGGVPAIFAYDDIMTDGA
jgi:1-aminocyclopropane-1-carboxylate deaminase/D-cysteine desulfhydrase-like pyridoxal-dependent ACC family enzyme